VRLPRDLGGEELAALLGRYGYEVTRQIGSHLRLTTMQQKLIAIDQGFWIENERGQDAFHFCRFRRIVLYFCYRWPEKRLRALVQPKAMPGTTELPW
jgi:hypothetical protein